MRGWAVRVRSPSGGSTLITSAPRSARALPHDGPDNTRDRSSTRTPSSGAGPASLTTDPTVAFLRAHHLSIQCADVAASASFYDTVIVPIGGSRIMDFGEVIGYGVPP